MHCIGKIAFCGLLCVACGEPRTPAEEDARQQCLLEADKAQDKQANLECHFKGIEWDECPARPRIMDELKRAQEKCR